MPFELANTGSFYSRMLEVAMKEVDREFWTSYLDNILTYSGEPWAHFWHLTQVVLARSAAGIKIQPCKTKLFQSKVKYLGQNISKGGVSMIRNTYRRSRSGPCQRQEVTRFLGFAGYYIIFIPQYSALTNGLNGIK